MATGEVAVYLMNENGKFSALILPIFISFDNDDSYP
jgi:hypothetical protein